MIYTNSFLKEEVSRSFMNSKRQKWRLLIYALIISLIAFGLSFLFTSLDGTVFSDAFPSLTSSNNFAILSILNIIVCLFIIYYFFRNYYSLTFAEIKSNRMYMLVKMGEDVKKIIFTRICTSILLPIAIYIISFVICFLLSLLLSYRVTLTAFTGLLTVAALCFIGITVLILTISLFIKKRRYAVSIFFVIFFSLMLYAFLGGFVSVASSITSVSSVGALFGAKTSFFLPVIIGLTVVLLFVCFFRANYLIKFYSINHSISDNVVVIDYTKDAPKKKELVSDYLKNKIFTWSTYVVFGAICLAAIASNIYLLIMSNKSLTNTTGVNQTVAVLFDSVTMTDTKNPEKSINRNDFVTFQTVDENYEIKQDDVIYYINDNHLAIVSYVVSISEDQIYTVDVKLYPSGTEEGSLYVDLPRSRIRGVCTFHSRELGAWFVFNQSIAGKIIMIGVPLFIIVFYDKIRYVARAYTEVEDTEEEKKTYLLK